MDSHTNPTIEEVKKWDADELLEWIEQQEPKLLKGDKLEKFKAADISGRAFLMKADNVEFFKKECNLPIGPSVVLADLAREIAGGETASIKSKLLSFIPCTPRRQQANSVAGNRQQAGDAETSDTASKRPRLESEDDDQLQELAASARRRRERIRQEIRKLDQPSVSHSEDVGSPPQDVGSPPQDVGAPPQDVVSRPRSVFQLSNPTFETKLPFPFVGHVVPSRFHLDGKGDEENWFYIGREKFTELLDKFEHLINDRRCTTLTLYGTRGYGKSHLLAALVCYLAARGERVVYIPDCRNFIENPVDDMISAMLFAWADDESKQQKIMALDTQDDIYQFFRSQKNIIFVADQTNSFEDEEGDNGETKKEKAEVHRWLRRCRARHKAILSSSANNHLILSGALRQSNTEIMYVYGGLAAVNLKGNNWFV
jgi:hypothetical protein